MGFPTLLTGSPIDCAAMSESGYYLESIILGFLALAAVVWYAFESRRIARAAARRRVRVA
jgi:uncharacterized membrane protein YiaA